MLTVIAVVIGSCAQAGPAEIRPYPDASPVVAAAYTSGATSGQQQTDTTFAVPARGQLSVETLNGTVSVTTWNRNAMRVRTRSGSRGDIEISRRGSSVDIEADVRRGRQHVNLDVSVPQGWSVALEGVNMRVAIDGLHAAVEVENVEGAVTVTNVQGPVSVESVSGDVTVRSVRGTVEVNTTNKAVRLEDIRGNIEAETVNGSIIMQRIDALRVEASTVQGIVEYHGLIRDGGRYYLGTHNGRITMSVPEQTNARISVNTHNGKVETSFPVQLTRLDSREYALTLGSGSARVELESYNGSVYLVRPGSR